jgi:hypothetical protein
MDKKQKIFSGLVLAIIFYVAIFEILGYRTTLSNRRDKKVLTIIMNELEIGDSKEKVKNIFYEYKTKTLELIDLTLIAPESLEQKRKENTWLIRMPYEFGAKDWILWIEFDENDKIIGLKMRVSDSKKFKPKDAPEDKLL